MSTYPPGGASEPDAARRLQEENARLREEVARLRLENESLDKKVREGAGQGASSRTIMGMTDLLVTVDPRGVIAYLNSPAEAHFRVSRTQAVGRRLTELRASTLDGGVLEACVAEARAQGKSVAREVTGVDPETKGTKTFLVNVGLTGEGAQILISNRTQLKQLEGALARYISPSVMELVLQSGFDPFSARKYELTVLFADLRGFTSMSSRLPPEQVKALIDEYLTVQIDVVLDAGATIDKIVGDEIMALFGAPLPAKEHALWAINTALKMRAGHRRLMELWSGRGLEGCGLGIGINTGEMVVGNIGSPRRMDFTVLGHHVNLGARLCSAAKAGEILMANRTFHLAKDVLTAQPGAIWCPVKFRKGETVNAKGISEPVETVVVVEA